MVLVPQYERCLFMFFKFLLPRIKLADIRILKGTVSNLKYMTHVSGGKESVSTGYVATFEIDGQSIILNGNEPLLIDVGDEIAISGYFEHGIFKSTAYYNVVKKIYNARTGGVICCIFAFIILFFGLVGALSLGSDYPILGILVSIGIAFVSYRIFHAGRIGFQVSKLIRKILPDL